MTTKSEEWILTHDDIKRLRDLLNIAKREARETVKDVAVMKHELVSLRNRALTLKHVQQKTWKIWGYCRINKDSLDSERHCAMIYEVIIEAISGVQKQLDESRLENAELRVEIKRLRSMLNAAGVKDDIKKDDRPEVKKVIPIRETK